MDIMQNLYYYSVETNTDANFMKLLKSIPGFATIFSCGFNIIYRAEMAVRMSIRFNIPVL